MKRRDEELTRALLKLRYMERKSKEFSDRFGGILSDLSVLDEFKSLDRKIRNELSDLVKEYEYFAFEDDYEMLEP